MVGMKDTVGEHACDAPSKNEEQAAELLLPEHGTGPLLQRDYWVVVKDSRLDPVQVVDLVARRFPEFAPEELCIFARTGAASEQEDAPLQVDDELEVRIRAAGTFGVRVLHRDAQSLTLATLRGHPEAGRITFGAYRNAHGDVLFHIRSRARSGSRFHFLGFVTAGEAMQTNTWTEFVTRVAFTVGEGVVGVVHAETTELGEEDEQADDVHLPTFAARGS